MDDAIFRRGWLGVFKIQKSAKLNLKITGHYAAVRHLKPESDGLRVIAERWPDLGEIFVVGDSWVDGQAAGARGVPFIAYRADHDELKRRGVPVWAAIAHWGDLPALFD